ncbi:putative polehole-like 1, partial [Homarus americanus]
MYRRRGRVCSTTLLGMFMWATIITASATITAVDFDTPHMALPGLPSIEDLMDSVPDQPFETLADVDAFMTSLMDLADLYLEKAFTAHTHRYKRALDVTSVTVTGTQIYNFNFFNPTEFNAASLERVSGRQLLATPEKVYWILGYPRSGWQSVIEMSRLDYRIKLLAKFRLESIAIDKIDRITLPNRLYVLIDNYFDRRDDVQLKMKGVQDITGFTDSKSFYYLVFGSGPQGKITLYSDDMTGHYFPTFTIDTGCHTVQDLRGMKMGPDYVITYICLGVDGTAISLQARSLILEELKLAELETTADDLLHCLDKADMLLDSRKPNITYLADLTISGSMMTVNGPQTWTGLVTFSRGLTVTGTTTFNNRVDIKPSGNIVPTSGSLAKLFSDIDDLKSSVEDLAEDLDNLLYHSGDQTINGPITASTLTADKLEIDVLQIQ